MIAGHGCVDTEDLHPGCVSIKSTRPGGDVLPRMPAGQVSVQRRVVAGGGANQRPSRRMARNAACPDARRWERAEVDWYGTAEEIREYLRGKMDP
jgi:hypothetical protein